VTAVYTLQQDGKIKVVNSCRQAGKSEPKKAEGVARIAEEDKGSNSVLDVRFAPAILSFLSTSWILSRALALPESFVRRRPRAIVTFPQDKSRIIASGASNAPDRVQNRTRET
jgi:hypothetical protein